MNKRNYQILLDKLTRNKSHKNKFQVYRLTPSEIKYISNEMNLKYSDSLWPRSFFSKNWSMESVYIYYKYGKNKLNGFSVKFELDYFKVKSKLKQDLIEMYNNKYET